MFGTKMKQLITQNTVPAVKHGGDSIMLQGCFFLDGTWTLFKIEGIIDSSKCQSVLATKPAVLCLKSEKNCLICATLLLALYLQAIIR